MSIVGWLIVGFVAGGLARIATGAERVGCLGTILTGIVGALLGGWLFRLVTDNDSNVVDDFDLRSMFVAFVGASVLLLLLQMFGVRRNDRR
jgi:uncharacterized membrane protein YeaQ/YmgE (transglycosylase-associated protein family)